MKSFSVEGASRCLVMIFLTGATGFGIGRVCYLRFFLSSSEAVTLKPI